uniref:Uncharacterized protein n=1 Tax=Timema cristinae TaxID=61476 RepID=A0A7R9H0F4_TIMCR|nr:unnamed protein product [Timema cristinae]
MLWPSKKSWSSGAASIQSTMTERAGSSNSVLQWSLIALLAGFRCVLAGPFISSINLETSLQAPHSSGAVLPIDRNSYDEREAKVLNFFPVPVSEECLSNDNRRIGTCLNTYECRIFGGGVTWALRTWIWRVLCLSSLCRCVMTTSWPSFWDPGISQPGPDLSGILAD